LRSQPCSRSILICSCSTTDARVDPSASEAAALLRAQAPSRATLVVTHDRVFAMSVGDRTIALGSEAVLVRQRQAVTSGPWVLSARARSRRRGRLPRLDLVRNSGLLGWALVVRGGPDSAKEIALVATLAGARRRASLFAAIPACSR
jgi:hypothetical protein